MLTPVAANTNNGGIALHVKHLATVELTRDANYASGRNSRLESTARGDSYTASTSTSSGTLTVSNKLVDLANFSIFFSLRNARGMRTAAVQEPVLPPVVVEVGCDWVVVVTGGLVMVVKPLLWVAVVPPVVVGAAAPGQWQVHSAEIKFGLFEQLAAQEGRPAVAVTTALVKEAQNGDAVAA
jgi:hypothetical protein